MQNVGKTLAEIVAKCYANTHSLHPVSQARINQRLGEQNKELKIRQSHIKFSQKKSFGLILL